MTATPVPRILPARSEPGRTQASRISTILLDFSSTTPMAMVWPPPMMTMIMRMSMRPRVAYRAPKSSESYRGGSSASTRGAAWARAPAVVAGSPPSAVTWSDSAACCRMLVTAATTALSEFSLLDTRSPGVSPVRSRTISTVPAAPSGDSGAPSSMPRAASGRAPDLDGPLLGVLDALDLLQDGGRRVRAGLRRLDRVGRVRRIRRVRRTCHEHAQAVGLLVVPGDVAVGEDPADGDDEQDDRGGERGPLEQLGARLACCDQTDLGAAGHGAAWRGGTR